jgi:hypothetical protein
LAETSGTGRSPEISAANLPGAHPCPVTGGGGNLMTGGGGDPMDRPPEQ